MVATATPLPRVTGGGGGGGGDDQGVQFAQCMRDNGIDVPDPDPNTGRIQIGGGGNINPNDPAFQAAIEACQDVAPFGGGGGGGGGLADNPEAQEALLEFAQCMRDNGVDMADPDFSGGGGGFLGGGELAEDPDFQPAIEACQPILAEVFGGRAGPLGGGN